MARQIVETHETVERVDRNLRRGLHFESKSVRLRVSPKCVTNH